MQLARKSVRAALLAAFASAISLCAAGTASAQSVVVRSSGPSAGVYPAGKKLGATDRITLKAQDSVTVLGKGGTRVLRGPGTFSLGDRSSMQQTSTTRLASFISDRGARRPRAGAFRGAGGEAPTSQPSKPNIWYLDVRTSGNFCVSPGGVALWRPDYTGSASVDIVAPTTGTITKVTWEPNDTLKPWPAASAPVTDGATYRLNASGLPAERSITFKLIAEPAPDEVALSEQLLAAGCQSQLDDLLALYESGPDQAAR